VHKKIFGRSAQEAHLRFLVATVGPPKLRRSKAEFTNRWSTLALRKNTGGSGE